MNYYIINTDLKSFTESNNIRIWLRKRMAFTGGAYSYGEQLAVLNPEDICLMYQNGEGVMAIGTVLESWDGEGHRPAIYYADAKDPEYRIGVDWFLDLTGNPIDIATLREVLGYAEPWAPSKAVTVILEGRDRLARFIDKLRGPNAG